MTDAIILSMMALELIEVFCPSFMATAEAIVLSGATPFL